MCQRATVSKQNKDKMEHGNSLGTLNLVMSCHHYSSRKSKEHYFAQIVSLRNIHNLKRKRFTQN